MSFYLFGKQKMAYEKISSVLIILIIITGTYSIDKMFDGRFQDDWNGACASGILQSPIAIPNAKDRTFRKLMKLEFTNMQLPITKFEVTNEARYTKFDWPRGKDYPQRYFVLRSHQNVAPFHANTQYVLQNVHVHHNSDSHTGTNHAISGNKYAMEMHFLFVLPKYDFNVSGAFEDGPGNTLEIVVLWKLSNVHNDAWSQFNNLMLTKKLSENENIPSNAASIRLSDFIPSFSSFSLYRGSMLYSPCLETNTWIVFDKIMEFDTADLGMRHWTYVSDNQVIQLDRNIRHIQSLNDRPVYHGHRQKVINKGYS